MNIGIGIALVLSTPTDLVSIMSNKTFVSLYGNVAIQRAYCYACGGTAFVIDGYLQCCGRWWKHEPDRIKREVEPEYKRRGPGLKEQRQILEAQDYRCIYCECAFHSIRFRRNRPIRLRIEWDHDIPFAYSQNNHTSNFVAACQVCNGLKSDLIFKDLDEARIRLRMRRAEKGFDF